MNSAKDSKNIDFPNFPAFLLCDITGNVEMLSLSGQWVSSPIQCLGRAIEERPRIIAIRFSQISLRDRKNLIDLCTELKRNRFTKEFKLLALLHTRHRKLIEELANVKADYLRYINDARLDLTLLHTMIDGLGPDDSLEAQLKSICPFIHYTAIDTHHEMTVCAAYLDRMVIGGNRLHAICETENHHCCKYYLNPRTT